MLFSKCPVHWPLFVETHTCLRRADEAGAEMKMATLLTRPPVLVDQLHGPAMQRHLASTLDGIQCLFEYPSCLCAPWLAGPEHKCTDGDMQRTDDLTQLLTLERTFEEWLSLDTQSTDDRECGRCL
jgi:hypothetical protein